MSFNSTTLLKLAALKLDPDQMAGVVEILADYEAAEEARKLAQRDRARKSRASRDRHVTATVAERDAPRGRVTRVEDKTLTSEIEPHSENKKRATSALDGFAEWYGLYPHKVQRGAAEKAWPRARSLASQDELIAGLRRYVASKPPERAWQNPATWLNGRGWEDQPAAPPLPMARASPMRPVDLLNAAINRLDLTDADPTEEASRNPAPAQLISFRQSG